MRVCCETYGCTFNKVDAEIIRKQIVDRGHELVDEAERADLVVVNTCAVKGTTYRRMLRRISELGRMNKRVVVAGCLPLIDLPAIERVGRFDAVIGCRAIDRFTELLERIERGEQNLLILEPKAKTEKPLMCKLRYSRTSAAVPIAEGCVSACSYCSVRLARGKLKSFSPEAVEREVKNLVSSGYREIQLTAQDTAAYGLDIGVRLPELLQQIVRIPGDFRIRVGMMNPRNVYPILDELIEVFTHQKVYKFLHLPLQSGSDHILRAMKRGYTTEQFVEIVKRFRKKIPDLSLCTDIIVGFPGETEEDFELTKTILQRVAPDKTNISKFYPMPRTEAAGMTPVDGRVVARRSRELTGICKRIGLEANQRFVGRVVSGFVIEEGQKGGYILRSENYKQVILRDAKLGEFLQARVKQAFPTYLIGEPAEAKIYGETLQ
jgi:MiaB-like tRNA modifying enzyme